MTPAVRRGLPVRRVAGHALSLALIGLAAGAPAGAQGGGDAPRGNVPAQWHSLEVPGGTARLLAAAGLDSSRPRTTALLAVIRVMHAVAPGLDPEVDERRTRVLAYLAALESQLPARASPGAPSDTVPLPLSEESWRSLTGLGAHSSRSLLGAILVDRRASLLYFGLCATDDETRAYLAAHPALVEHLYAADRAPLAAVFARALHVRDGRVETPGGPGAVPLWEAVVGEPVTQVEPFILAVLARDNGRLAFLYDAVAHMDAPRQKFALGLWIDDPERRLVRFKALYSACADDLRHSHLLARPFARVLYDPAQVLLLARVSEDGRPGPLGWRSFWERALAAEELPPRPDADVANVEEGGVLDAAAVLDVVVANRTAFRGDVAEAWCFGERVFSRAPRSALPDVLVAVRGFRRYRSLVLTLERLGIDNPSVYVAALRRADRIAGIKDADRGAIALSLYQGALALIERSRLARTIDASTAGSLVDSLARLPLSPGGDDRGAVASWIDTRFLPAIGVDTAPPREGAPATEVRVLAAFAGRGHDASQALRTVDYEGMRYRLDPAGVELARIEAVRDSQRTVSLDAALAFSREVGRLAAGVRSPTEIAPRIGRLEAEAAPLLAYWRALPDWKGGAAMRSSMAEAARDLEGLHKTAEPRLSEDRVARLSRAADRQLGRVLVSLAYAVALPDPHSTTLLAGDPSLAHDWGFIYGDVAARSRAAWALPSDSRDDKGRWHVHGSLLALDLCLGTEALHRLSSDALPAPPTMSEDDFRGFTQAALLSNAFDYRDEDMALLAGAMRRGGLRVATLVLEPSQLPELAAAAGLDEARRELLAWAIVHEPNRVAGFFSLVELVHLGLAPGQHLPRLDAWGASGLSYDGRLSLRFPTSQPFATLAGRRARGVMAALDPDLPLLIAEMLDERRLPAALTRSLLMLATLDYTDRLALASEDDWMALVVGGGQGVVPARMDDYLASLTTAGPLVPVTRTSEGKQP